MRKFAPKCYTLYFGTVNCQKSNFKVRIYVNERLTFLKSAPLLTLRVKKSLDKS